MSGYEIKPFVQVPALLLVALEICEHQRLCHVVTLRRIISSGYVAEPFTTHPQLHLQLLHILGMNRDIVQAEC